jgi:hypothetical protein
MGGKAEKICSIWDLPLLTQSGTGMATRFRIHGVLTQINFA